MLYRELLPPPELENVVLSFWEFAAPSDPDHVVDQKIFPDGCISLFFYHSAKRSISVVGISGLYRKSQSKPISPGDTVWGMRFSPAAAFAILKSTPQNLVGRSTFDESEYPHLMNGLRADLRSVRSLETAMPVFGERVRFAVDSPYFDGKMNIAVRQIDKVNGDIRVSEIASAIGLSIRQFERRFKASSGLPPKIFIRARRMRALAIDLIDERSNSWSRRATDLGFADQSHLNHEVSSITTVSPGDFARMIGQIDHGDLIK